MPKHDFFVAKSNRQHNKIKRITKVKMVLPDVRETMPRRGMLAFTFNRIKIINFTRLKFSKSANVFNRFC